MNFFILKHSPSLRLCTRAVLSHGEDAALIFVDVGSIGDGYVALHYDEIDVLAGGIKTLTTDMKEPRTSKGFAFTPPYF